MNKTLIINKIDNVAVALTSLSKGESYEGITLIDDIPVGHKFALVDTNENEDVIKYGYPIGHATQKILKGSHVHVNNVKTNLGDELSYSYTQKFVENKYKDENIKVNVFKRKFNRYGIRNNLFIVPLVGCVNAQAELIKQNVLKQIDTNLIDDIIITKHPYGCSQMGDDMVNTVTTLQAIVKHPNAGGVLVLALG
jgi:altronate hydrolase